MNITVEDLKALLVKLKEDQTKMMLDHLVYDSFILHGALVTCLEEIVQWREFYNAPLGFNEHRLEQFPSIEL